MAFSRRKTTEFSLIKRLPVGLRAPKLVPRPESFFGASDYRVGDMRYISQRAW